MNNPIISVVMPVYNAELYIADSINSVLEQTFKNLELVVAIDAESNDDSLAIVESYIARDSRVKVVFSESHGVSGTLNTGIAATQGEYIAFCDADDILVPERFTAQLQWMQMKSVDVAGGCVQFFRYNNAPLWFPEDHFTIQMVLLFQSALIPSAVMARTNIIKENLFTPGIKFNDYELWTRLAIKYRLGNMQRVLAKYRIHKKQATQVHADSFLENLIHIRRTYFFALFTDANEDDFIAISRMYDTQSYCDINELQRLGSWVIRMSQSPDIIFKKRLAQNWLESCIRSAHLGKECYDTYLQTADKIGLKKLPDDSGLQLLCKQSVAKII